MPRQKLDQAYTKLSFRWRSRNWWARLTRVPPECVHLEHGGPWMATFIPDTLFLRGKATVLRSPTRPEVSLCRDCLLGELERELPAYSGRIVAFEPDAADFSQYFFVGTDEFTDAGLQPEVGAAIERRLAQPAGQCDRCESQSTWVWLSRGDVPGLDDVERIRTSRGEELCARHGAEKLCESLAGIPEANLFYVNIPYGEAGAYVWI